MAKGTTPALSRPATLHVQFGGEITGISIETYRYMLSIRDQFMTSPCREVRA